MTPKGINVEKKQKPCSREIATLNNDQVSSSIETDFKTSLSRVVKIRVKKLEETCNEHSFFPARANYFDEWRQYPGGAAAGKILKKNSSELREGHFLSVKHLLRRASTRQT